MQHPPLPCKRRILRWSLALGLVVGSGPHRAHAQGPTLPETLATEPGTIRSTLGASPGSGGNPFGMSPGAGDEILGGRPGPSSPRVPTSVTTPGGALPAPPHRIITAPPRLPVARVPLYGTL